MSNPAGPEDRTPRRARDEDGAVSQDARIHDARQDAAVNRTDAREQISTVAAAQTGRSVLCVRSGRKTEYGSRKERGLKAERSGIAAVREGRERGSCRAVDRLVRILADARALRRKNDRRSTGRTEPENVDL